MSTLQVPPKPATLPPVKETPIGSGAYLALIAALLGWMFDGAEMGVFSLVGIAAISDLLPQSSPDTHKMWITVVNAAFLVGAATGGVLFGWLGDRIGRVRAMALSVVTYALFTGLCGFCPEAWQVGTLRFIAALGMGGEWSLGVALVMEVWPNRSRAFMAGLIGAAANFGYLLVGIIGLMLSQLIGSVASGIEGLGYSPEATQHMLGKTGWRLIMVMGTLPALLTFFIRMFVPESDKWEKEDKVGSTSHWVSTDLLMVVAGVVGPAMIIVLWAWPYAESNAFWLVPARILGTIFGLAIAVAGYSFPALKYCQRLEAASGRVGITRMTIGRMLVAACLSGVALLGTWGSTQNISNWVYQVINDPHKAEIARLKEAGDNATIAELERPAVVARSVALIVISVGAIVGTIIAAFLGDWVGRRWAYVLMCALSMASIIYLFAFHTQYGMPMMIAAFLAGACTASFYGWLPLYLPELFVTSVRASGQGFGFNFGRVLAAVGALQMTNLFASSKTWFGDGLNLGGFHINAGWPVLCCLLSLIYLVGMGIIWLAPETKGQPLPE
jgi:MFS transporter, SHS family, sialic acid transporter